MCGGGGAKSAPAAPKPAPLAPAVVAPMDAEPSSQSAADQERKRRQAASGRSDTILTRGMGLEGVDARTGGKQLLGQ